MNELKMIPTDKAPLELLVRFAEALVGLPPEERQVLLFVLSQMTKPRLKITE